MNQTGAVDSASHMVITAAPVCITQNNDFVTSLKLKLHFKKIFVRQLLQHVHYCGQQNDFTVKKKCEN